jgi:hypothetical protein
MQGLNHLVKLNAAGTTTESLASGTRFPTAINSSSDTIPGPVAQRHFETHSCVSSTIPYEPTQTTLNPASKEGKN